MNIFAESVFLTIWYCSISVFVLNSILPFEGINKSGRVLFRHAISLL